MATDLTAGLNNKSLPGAKTIRPLDFAGSASVDLHQDRHSSCIGPNSSTIAAKGGVESKLATVGRISGCNDSVYDIFKRIRRAERFGIPVHLSEAEKRYSRAERFGTVSACGPDEMVKAKTEDLKRKARAERFQLLTSPEATIEEAKKKARLARFAAFL